MRPDDWPQGPPPGRRGFTLSANAGALFCCADPHPDYGSAPNRRAFSPLRGCHGRDGAPLDDGDARRFHVPPPRCGDVQLTGVSFSPTWMFLPEYKFLDGGREFLSVIRPIAKFVAAA